MAAHAPGSSARRMLVALVGASMLAACTSGHPARPRTDVPEPAASPPTRHPPAGRVVSLAAGSEPEGIAADDVTHTLAVGVRNPDGVILADLPGGTVQRRVALPGAPRHLQLAAPGGPLLVPSEGDDHLYLLALPDGRTLSSSPVGRQPHDATAAGGASFVGDELADTVHVVRPGAPAIVRPGPVQPGGVAAAGGTVMVVGVRGRRIEQLSAAGDVVGSAPCGVGPTHVRAGPDGRFFVADTQGGAVLVFTAGPHGPVKVGSVHTGGAPYGLGVDARRGLLYVTLTATNELRSFRIAGNTLHALHTWATPRQPNDVTVDPATGQVVVAGTADGVLQLLDSP